MTERDRRTPGDSVVTGHLLILISIGVAVGILILIGVLFFIGLPPNDPSADTLAELGVAGDNAVQTISQLREQRFESIRELMKLLVIALAVPMLAIALGYFSERTPKKELERERERLAARLKASERKLASAAPSDPDLSSEEAPDAVSVDRHTP